METFDIYTDGGSRGNPGLGGWAFYNTTTNESNTGVKEYTTNNEMELTAIYEALNSKSLSGKNVNINIYSDSSYCINTLTQWAYNWIKSNTLKSRPNNELIRKILDIINIRRMRGCEINFIKVKGHSGVPGNELVDRMLNKAMDNFIKYASQDPILPTNLIITNYIVGRSLNDELYIDATLSDGTQKLFKEV